MNEKQRSWEELRQAFIGVAQAITAPFIPLLDRLEKWLEERGKH